MNLQQLTAESAKKWFIFSEEWRRVENKMKLGTCTKCWNLHQLKLPPFSWSPWFQNIKISSELTWEVLPLETTFSNQVGPKYKGNMKVLYFHHRLSSICIDLFLPQIESPSDIKFVWWWVVSTVIFKLNAIVKLIFVFGFWQLTIQIAAWNKLG